jgi:hypothetical protein
MHALPGFFLDVQGETKPRSILTAFKSALKYQGSPTSRFGIHQNRAGTAITI